MPFLADGIETGLIRFSYAVPAITALRDIRRPGPGRPSWLEWASLGLAATLFLIAEPTELIRDYSVAGPTESRAANALVREGALLAAIILGVCVNWWPWFIQRRSSSREDR